MSISLMSNWISQTFYNEDNFVFELLLNRVLKKEGQVNRKQLYSTTPDCTKEYVYIVSLLSYIVLWSSPIPVCQERYFSLPMLS